MLTRPLGLWYSRQIKVLSEGPLWNFKDPHISLQSHVTSYCLSFYCDWFLILCATCTAWGISLKPQLGFLLTLVWAHQSPVTTSHTTYCWISNFKIRFVLYCFRRRKDRNRKDRNKYLHTFPKYTWYCVCVTTKWNWLNLLTFLDA